MIIVFINVIIKIEINIIYYIDIIEMLRQCTDVDTFISNHGVDSYRETFRPLMTNDDLLMDLEISRANKYYENKNGITEQDIFNFIEHWGAEKYREWCARDSTYAAIIEKYSIAQDKYLEKIVDGHVKINVFDLSRNPFRRELRNHKGEAVPEPPTTPSIKEPYDTSAESFIRKNGIIHYMIRTTSKKTLEELLEYDNIAKSQKSYIYNLDYESHLF